MKISNENTHVIKNVNTKKQRKKLFKQIDSAIYHMEQRDPSCEHCLRKSYQQNIEAYELIKQMTLREFVRYYKFIENEAVEIEKLTNLLSIEADDILGDNAFEVIKIYCNLCLLLELDTYTVEKWRAFYRLIINNADDLRRLTGEENMFTQLHFNWNIFYYHKLLGVR